MENQKLAMLFSGDTDISPQEKSRVEDELSKIGKMLTFKITKDEEGWVAQCNEVSGIIAGGLNSEPADSEIVSQIRESIFAAFSVETKEPTCFSFQEEGVNNLACSPA